MGSLIVKDNALIEASYALDLPEQRLILLAILEARNQQETIKAGSLLRIYAPAYMEHFNVEKHTAYQVLKNAALGLYNAGFSYSKIDEKSGKIAHYKSHWVDKVGYINELGCVELSFASDVIPLITKLERCFTEYQIKQVSSLSSRYAIRLYELIIQWRSTGQTLKFSLEHIRNQLGLLPDEYKIMSDFKRRVMDLAIEQINQYTDIDVQYQQHKQGKTITGFTFSFTNKVKKIDASIENKLQLENENSTKLLNENQAKLFASKLVSNASFGGQFAHVGEELKAFENRINKELQDAKKIKKYLPFLRELGLKM